ncbi:MAG: TauD/TfdA family dioxygenase, partial [Novosphingobium sp.]|nr:TauD/TfdA family dioxygenase [Novosphingobium sp.]
MATKTRLSIKPQTRTIGSVIHGLDLREALDPDSIVQIREALIERGVIFFPGQDITGEQLHDFVAHFGRPIHIDYFGRPEDATHETACTRDEVVSGSLTATRQGTAIWHSDISWIPRPPFATALRAVSVPEVGGDTCWADMEAAWDGLSAPMRAMLDGLSAVHSMKPTLDREMLLAASQKEQQRPEIIENILPLVTIHPETGRKALYVSECSTTRIVELAPLESMQVLTALFLHIRNPEFAMRWRWTQGDLAFWDNR